MIYQTRTDIGRVRKKNEDAVFAGEALFILCDGMGGHQGGEVASRMAVEAVAERLHGREASIGALLSAVAEANALVYGRALAEADRLGGMGTTLTALWAAPDAMLIAQVGDSRAYLLRGGLLKQCTHDHSMVADLVRAGQLTPRQAREHPHKNLVTRALGTEPTVDTDVFEYTRRPGDRWLLCSDGLTDQVLDGEIASILSGEALDAAADALVALALSRGGPDNISVLLLSDEGGGAS